jgi:small subunit ribosomal protein S20
MPLLKHARKKLRQDKKRTLANKKVKTTYKSMLKEAKENPTAESISAAVSSVDKAVKNHIIHANKAARIKSSLSKVTPDSAAKKKTVKNAPPSKKAKATKVKATKAAAKKASTKTTKKK